MKSKHRIEAEYRVRTPRQLRYPPISEADRCFCHLVVLCGYPQSDAYRIAYHNHAKAVSNAALACRRLKDPSIIDYCDLLRRYYDNHQLEPCQ